MDSPLHPQPSPRSASRGFTLVEFLVVLAIASILLGGAIPSFTSFFRSVNLTSTTNDLFASMLMARSEAAKRRSRVALCKSANGTSCTTQGGWEQGWIVFHDTNSDGLRQGGEEIVWRAQAMPGDIRVQGNITVAKYVSYAPTGEAKFAGGGFQAGTITLCNASSSSQNARQIVISSSGRPRVQKAQVSNCT
jgi:type IV fimbrial biogenesis protein FimT